MKNFLLALLCLGSACTSFAQSELDLNGIDRVIVQAKLSPVFVGVSGTAQASVQQLVAIDNQDVPEFKELEIKRSGSTLIIEEKKPTLDQLKVRFPDGYQAVTFGDTTTQQIRDMGKYQGRQNLPTINSQITVLLPANMRLEVENEYGPIRVKGMEGIEKAHTKYGTVEVFLNNPRKESMSISSQYGNVDISLAASTSADLTLKTSYGELFTDFAIDVDTDASQSGDFKENVVGKIGRGGPSIYCETPYGNVYLRKSN